MRTVPVTESEVRYGTMQEDLESLVGDRSLDRAIMLFHSPPYKSALDRAALDGRMVDFVPMDVHVGSIAIQRLISRRQPLVTLHGHVHESARMTGEWSTRLGATHAFSGAHDGPELALVRFDPEEPARATRELL
jgi:Icc-related predicted phosphoesterase